MAFQQDNEVDVPPTPITDPPVSNTVRLPKPPLPKFTFSLFLKLLGRAQTSDMLASCSAIEW
jgi:hypothetical protein